MPVTSMCTIYLKNQKHVYEKETKRNQYHNDITQVHWLYSISHKLRENTHNRPKPHDGIGAARKWKSLHTCHAA